MNSIMSTPTCTEGHVVPTAVTPNFPAWLLPQPPASHAPRTPAPSRHHRQHAPSLYAHVRQVRHPRVWISAFSFFCPLPLSLCLSACLSPAASLPSIRCFCQRLENQITKPEGTESRAERGDVSKTAGPPVREGPGLSRADVVSAVLAAQGFPHSAVL